MKKYLLLLLIALPVLPVLAQQQYVLSGRITDSASMPISFASVYIRNSTYGTIANEQGRYQLKLSPGTYEVVYRFVGYREIAKKITINTTDQQMDVQMQDDAYQLKEYARYNKTVKDSANDIMRQVIAKREFFLRQVDKYSCVVYIKGVQKLVSSPKALMTPSVAAALSVDSTGKGILYQNESLSYLNFQQPGKIKEVRIASRAAGQNTSFTYNNSTDFSVNFYNNVFTLPGLSSHGFVSPVAKNAMHYYHYNLLGKKLENGIVVDKIQVLPKRRHDPVFTGNIYIVEGDWRIYGVDLMLTNKDNELNLVDTLKVSQQYVPITDSVWQPLSVQYSFKGNVLGFKYEGYYLSIYNNYKLGTDFPPKFFNGERLRIDTFANDRDTLYWQRNRPVPLTRQESADYVKKDFMEDMQKSINKYKAISTKNNFYVLPYLVFGYHAAYRDDRDSLYIYPFIQTLFYNTVEGLGINLQATYQHFFSDQRSYSLTPDIKYGFADKLFSASIHGIYNYDPFNRGAFFGGFGSDILDLSNVGTRSLYFNTLSTLLSERNFVKYYRSQFVNFGFQHDITNGLFWTAQLTYANRTQLYNNSYYSFKNYKDRQFTSNNPLMPDAPANDRSELFPQNQALTFATSLTLTFDQQYITRPTGRTYLPSVYPQIRLNYRKGINALGSDVNYDFASVEVFHEHLPIGLIGYSAFKVVAGDFFNKNKLYFMDYNHFLGNQGTTFNPTPGNFHFLPFYTYSASGAFLEAHYEHNFAGYFFNSVPLLRKLKLDEIIGANYLSENTNRSYYEFFVGVQRLIFRVDYGISYAGNKKYLQGFRIFYGIK